MREHISLQSSTYTGCIDFYYLSNLEFMVSFEINSLGINAFNLTDDTIKYYILSFLQHY